MTDTTQARSAREESVGSDGRRLLESNREVIEQAAALLAAIERAGSEWRSFLRDRLDRQPYVTLGAALGFGYVLGAGMPAAVMSEIAAVGGRMVLMNIIKELMKTGAMSPTAGTSQDPPAARPHD